MHAKDVVCHKGRRAGCSDRVTTHREFRDATDERQRDPLPGRSRSTRVIFASPWSLLEHVSEGRQSRSRPSAPVTARRAARM